MKITQAKAIEFARLLRDYRNNNEPLIRVGRDNDGGYLIEDPIMPIPIVFSMGIETDASFDLHFALKGIKVFQFDPNIEAPPIENTKFVFSRVAISHITSATTISLTDAITKPDCDVENAILKFDIEGHEWMALASIDPKLLGRFQTIVGEFHFFDAIADKRYYDLFMLVLKKLALSHTLTHLHPNNRTGISIIEGVILPRLAELTWRRSDISMFSPNLGSHLSPLDLPCDPEKPEILLPNYWMY